MGFPIPTPPGGTAYVYTVLQNVLNGSWQLALEKSDAFAAKMDAAASTWIDPDTSPRHITSTTLTPATVAEPVVSIPPSVDVSTILSDFDSTSVDLANRLTAGCASFISTYFPAEPAIFAQAESWLSAEITNPDRVLPPALADIIWEEDRSRILADTSRAAEQVTAFWAAKRYPLPPGSAIAAVTQIELAGHNELSKSSRNVAIKTFEMAYEKVKFAISNALETRKQAMAATLDYIKALATAPATASQVVGIGYDAQSKLISAVSSFYNARTEAVKLTFAGSEYNARATQGASERNQSADLQMLGDKFKGMLSEAAAIGQMATALFNNLSAQASASGSDTVSS